MHRVVMPVATTESTEQRLQISVHLQTEVVAPEIARRRANAWLLEYVGNLLRAETPELILGERLIWRLDIVLTHPDVGTVGTVGRIEVDATTGEMITDVEKAEELIATVYALVED